MCFDALATPPPLPPEILTDEFTSDELALESMGTEFRAYVSLAPSSSRTAVVILPDVRGLFGYYEQLTTRFAAAGHHAIAFDYFGRTAGLSPRRTTSSSCRTSRRRRPSRSAPTLPPASPRCARGRHPPCGDGGILLRWLSVVPGVYRHLPRAQRGHRVYGGLDPSRLGVFPRPAEQAASMRGPILALSVAQTHPSPQG